MTTLSYGLLVVEIVLFLLIFILWMVYASDPNGEQYCTVMHNVIELLHFLCGNIFSILEVDKYFIGSFVVQIYSSKGRCIILLASKLDS